jgi:hypothetical protein
MVDATEGHEGYVRVKLEATGNYSACTDPYFTSVPFDTDVAMEKIYTIGTRNAVDTVEGVIEITGSIERPYFEAVATNDFIDGTHSLADVCGLYGGNVSKCTIAVSPNSNFTYFLHEVKFSSYSLGLAAQEITTERCDYTSNNISTS